MARVPILQSDARLCTPSASELFAANQNNCQHKPSSANLRCTHKRRSYAHPRSEAQQAVETRPDLENEQQLAVGGNCRGCVVAVRQAHHDLGCDVHAACLRRDRFVQKSHADFVPPGLADAQRHCEPAAAVLLPAESAAVCCQLAWPDSAHCCAPAGAACRGGKGLRVEAHPRRDVHSEETCRRPERSLLHQCEYSRLSQCTIHSEDSLSANGADSVERSRTVDCLSHCECTVRCRLPCNITCCSTVSVLSAVGCRAT